MASAGRTAACTHRHASPTIEDARPSREALGRAGWTVLHTYAERYADSHLRTSSPLRGGRFTAGCRADARLLLRLFRSYFPCAECRGHFRPILSARLAPHAAAPQGGVYGPDGFRRVCWQLHDDVSTQVHGSADFPESALADRWGPGPPCEGNPALECGRLNGHYWTFAAAILCNTGQYRGGGVTPPAFARDIVFILRFLAQAHPCAACSARWGGAAALAGWNAGATHDHCDCSDLPDPLAPGDHRCSRDTPDRPAGGDRMFYEPHELAHAMHRRFYGHLADLTLATFLSWWRWEPC
jgi:hypothetical protein